MLPHPIYPEILTRKDACAEIQDLCPRGLSTLWKKPLTSYQGARRKGRSSGLLLSQSGLDQKPTRIPRREPKRHRCGTNLGPTPNPLQTGKTLLYLWRNRQTDRDASRPTHSETEQQTGSNRLQSTPPSTEPQASTRLLRLSPEDSSGRIRWPQAVQSDVSSTLNKPCSGSWRAVCAETCKHCSEGRG